MTPGGLQEGAGLLEGQRAAGGPGSGRRRDQGCDVAGHQALPLGVPEHLDEHAAHLLQARPGVAGQRKAPRIR